MANPENTDSSSIIDKNHPLPKRILVIGGGPSGLVTLRNLLLHGNFERVELVERRNDIGGVWYLESTQEGQTNPPRWQSPAYPGLVGNVLPEFLSFSSYPPFPKPKQAPDQPFPSLQETYNYLKGFTKQFTNGQIRVNTEVVRVEERDDGRWSVILRNSKDGIETKETWDAVAVATGIHSKLYWPPTEGLETLRQRGLAFHAQYWKGPNAHGLVGKKALVIGNANSSNDIAAQLAVVAPSTGLVYRSIRRPAFHRFKSLPDERLQDVKPVKRYTILPNGKAAAELSDGSVIEDLDAVVAGTGYLSNPDYVYVKSDATSELKNLMQGVTPHRIPSLHEHILYAPNPSLAIVGCLVTFTPFTIADLNSAWLALAWSNELAYPATVEGRLQWEKERLEAVRVAWEEERKKDAEGEPTNYISYNVTADGEQAYAERLKKEIYESGEKGRKVAETLPVWDDEQSEVRERMYPLKLEALKWAKAHPAI